MSIEEKRKLVIQISQLCEKKYRQGFHQGFVAFMQAKMKHEEVKKFRKDGKEEGHNIVKSPGNSWFSRRSIEQLRMESRDVDFDMIASIIRDVELNTDTF